jgi:hypothetical protein
MTGKKSNKKPLAIEQEAKSFLKTKDRGKLPETVPPEVLPPSEELLAASVLSGLLASGSRARAEELVEEAYKYVKLLLQYKTK